MFRKEPNEKLRSGGNSIDASVLTYFWLLDEPGFDFGNFTPDKPIRS